MALALTKSNLKKLEYGREKSFARGIKGRPTKADPSRVVMLLNGRIKGIKNPIKVRLGVFPDIDIDTIEAKASKYRALMADGIHPKAYEETQAEERLSKLKEERAKDVTLEELLTEYESDREINQRGIAESTKKDRRYTITHVFKSYMDRPIGALGANELDEIFNDWATKKKKRETVKKGWRYLNSLFNYAVKTKEYLDRNPLEKFSNRIKITSEKKRESLTPDQCQELTEAIGHLTDPENQKEWARFRALPSNSISQDRDVLYDFVALLLLSGIRKRELMNLKWSDVFLEKHEYRIWRSNGPYFQLITSKQGQPLGIPITDYMMGPFNRLKKRRINEFVFPSSRPGIKIHAPINNERKVYPILQQCLPEGTPRLTAQLFRKTFATTAYRLGFEMKIIELMTGHYGKLEAGNVAMDQYIAVNVDHHREGFERIHMEMLGAYDDSAERHEPSNF
jgi:integrase|tara:strand:+ start:249 stop:1607 length:1359 start_codon:yes stop_codon:yes gene_type:complete